MWRIDCRAFQLRIDRFFDVLRVPSSPFKKFRPEYLMQLAKTCKQRQLHAGEVLLLEGQRALQVTFGVIGRVQIANQAGLAQAAAGQ